MDTTYQDEDFVYVDPKKKAVVGKVRFTEAGVPISLEMVFDEPAADAASPVKGRKPLRKPRKRMYPWGTYKSMKRIYQIEGKVKDEEAHDAFDTILAKALENPYWD